MNFNELKEYLDVKAEQYNQKEFIENDPISIPHIYTLKQDIEISAFLVATISWGNRKSILQSSNKMMNLMENSPYDFIKNFKPKDIQNFKNKAIHRTFSGEDFMHFLLNLQHLYTKNDSLEKYFLLNTEETDFGLAIDRFRIEFLKNPNHRSKKHVSSPSLNSASKRLIMFLRWMVRQDKNGVDFGIWKEISPSYLSIPLDVHTGRIARQLGMITRKSNDWKTVLELDKIIRKMDHNDPSKYDYALFGIGVSKEID